MHAFAAEITIKAFIDKDLEAALKSLFFQPTRGTPKNTEKNVPEAHSIVGPLTPQVPHPPPRRAGWPYLAQSSRACSNGTVDLPSFSFTALCSTHPDTNRVSGEL